MKTDVYLHADGDKMYNKGEGLGLTGEALRMFSYACYEVRLTCEVADDGEATITHVDGREVKK